MRGHRTFQKRRCFHVILRLFVIFFLSGILHAAHSSPNKPLKIYAGIYPIHLYEFDLKAGRFEAEFYLWFRWKGPKKLPGFEIMNAKFENVGTIRSEIPGGFHYEVHRIRGSFFVKVNLRSYPFDKHSLEIHVENSALSRDEAVYVPDVKNLGDLKRGSVIAGWETSSFSLFEHPHAYNTNFGNTIDPKRTVYSQLAYRVRVERNILPYVIKYSIPLFVIVFMAFSTFFIHPKELEVRAGIGVTSILSAIAFHISQADALPEVGYLVTADMFFILSYFACAVALIISIANHNQHEKGNLERALKRDRRAKFVMPLLYFFLFFFVIFAS